MKILLNGFEFEIMSDDTQVTVKVTDAEGTELSNNTYTQKTASDEVKPAQMPSVQDETGAQTQVQPGAQETTQPVAEDESLIPSLESIKKKT